MRGLSAVERRGSPGACPGPSSGRGVAAWRVEVELTPQAVERVAARVALLLSGRQGQAEPELIGAGELARRLGVERPWVYRHREMLGGLRLDQGPRSPLRFNYARTIARLRKLEGDGDEGGER